MDRIPPLDALGPASAFGRLRSAARADPDPPWVQRADRLRRLRRLLVESQDAWSESIAADFGQRSALEVGTFELFPCVGAIDHALKHGRRWMRPQRPWANGWALPGRCEIRPQPLGVVGIIAPWNYPLYLSVGPLVDALAAGNRVMLKVSEHTPNFGARFAAAVAQAFGPDEVVVVQGGADVATAFSALPFDHLLFTGSTAIGREVMRAASAHLTPVTLELGGKSPALIGPSASLTRAAPALLRGKLVNAGQTCVAPDYVLVPRARLDDLVRELQQAARQADPTQSEPRLRTHIINERQLVRLRRLMDEACAAGARAVALLPGAERPVEGRDFPATLLLDCPADAAVMQEEIFGPLLPLLAYDTLDEAIAFVNARPRPLALYVFDEADALVEQVLARTVSGGVTVNDTLLHLAQHSLPFGGVGPSGLGAYHGEAGFQRFSHRKSVFHQSRWSPIGLLRPPSGRLFQAVVRWMIGG